MANELKALLGYKKFIVQGDGLRYDVKDAIPLLVVCNKKKEPTTREELRRLSLKYAVCEDEHHEEAIANGSEINSFVDFLEEGTTRRIRMRFFRLTLRERKRWRIPFFNKDELKVLTIATVRHYTDGEIMYQTVVKPSADLQTPIDVANWYGSHVKKTYIPTCPKHELLSNGVFLNHSTDETVKDLCLIGINKDNGVNEEYVFPLSR